MLQEVVDSAAAIGGHRLQLSPLDIDLTANGALSGGAIYEVQGAQVDRLASDSP